MYIIFGLLTLVFVVLGFVGFVGGIPLLVFWGLAVLSLLAMIKTYPRHVKGPEKATKSPE